MFAIGQYTIPNRLLLSPMAGITDFPFRKICKEYGAGLTSAEMLTSDVSLWDSPKSKTRLPQREEAEPRCTQIAGTDPKQMAMAARFSHEKGAQIIDINMGCPAKKVCNKAAGSALMQDKKTVQSILSAVTKSVEDTPVTLKIRTGWSRQNRNALEIAKIAQDAGINAITIHGRTRADAYRGFAEYETVRRIKQAVSIPVIVNGDIQSQDDVDFALHYTGADAVMLGRAAQGSPWVFSELQTSPSTQPSVSRDRKISTVMSHIRHIHSFFGESMGIRIARKHIGWYLDALSYTDISLKKKILTEKTAFVQLQLLEDVLHSPPT